MVIFPTTDEPGKIYYVHNVVKHKLMITAKCGVLVKQTILSIHQSSSKQPWPSLCLKLLVEKPKTCQVSTTTSTNHRQTIYAFVTRGYPDTIDIISTGHTSTQPPERQS